MRGKKTAPETIYAIMAVWAMTDNFAETAKKLNIPEKTVEKIVKTNKDKEEFAELCGNVRKDFAARATELIDKVLDRMEETIADDEIPIPLNQLSSALGMLYDKRALAQGEATENTKITFELPEEVKDFAG